MHRSEPRAVATGFFVPKSCRFPLAVLLVSDLAVLYSGFVLGHKNTGTRSLLLPVLTARSKPLWQF